MLHLRLRAGVVTLVVFLGMIADFFVYRKSLLMGPTYKPPEGQTYVIRDARTVLKMILFAMIRPFLSEDGTKIVECITGYFRSVA